MSKSFRPRSGMAAGLAVILMAISAQPSAAVWHDQSRDLPGMVSGKSIALTAGLIGGGVAGLILFSKLHKRGPESQLELPRLLEFSGTGERVLAIHNRGSRPVNIGVLEVQGDEFELVTVPRTPAILSPGAALEVPIRMTSNQRAKGRIRVSYVEDGKSRNAAVTLRGQPAAERSASSFPIERSPFVTQSLP